MEREEFIQRLRVACETRRLPGDVARRLDAGLRTHINSGVDLGRCLGLSGIGKEAICSAILRSERNRFLRMAIRSAGVGCGTAEKIRRTSVLIEKGKSRIWPRYKDKVALPGYYSKTEALLFSAFKVGLPVPGSVKQLTRIEKQRT